MKSDQPMFLRVGRIIERAEPYLVLIFNGQYAMR